MLTTPREISDRESYHGEANLDRRLPVSQFLLQKDSFSGEAVRTDIFIGPFKLDQYEPLAIEILDLSSNRIHSLNAKTFEHLPNLQVLYLHGNPLKVVDEHTITALTSALHLQVTRPPRFSIFFTFL